MVKSGLLRLFSLGIFGVLLSSCVTDGYRFSIDLTQPSGEQSSLELILNQSAQSDFSLVVDTYRRLTDLSWGYGDQRVSIFRGANDTETQFTTSTTREVTQTGLCGRRVVRRTNNGLTYTVPSSEVCSTLRYNITGHGNFEFQSGRLTGTEFRHNGDPSILWDATISAESGVLGETFSIRGTTKIDGNVRAFELSYKQDSGRFSGYFEVENSERALISIDFSSAAQMTEQMRNRGIDDAAFPSVQSVLLYATVQAGHFVYGY